MHMRYLTITAAALMAVMIPATAVAATPVEPINDVEVHCFIRALTPAKIGPEPTAPIKFGFQIDCTGPVQWMEVVVTLWRYDLRTGEYDDYTARLARFTGGSQVPETWSFAECKEGTIAQFHTHAKLTAQIGWSMDTNDSNSDSVPLNC